MDSASYDNYLLSEINTLNSLIPDLNLDIEGKVNFNNVNQLDILLYHISTTFYIQVDDNRLFHVPSVSMVRILLTLASRLPLINWSKPSNSNIDSLGESREIISPLSSCTLRDRSITILNTYLDFINSSKSKQSMLLYNVIMDALNDFTVMLKKKGSLSMLLQRDTKLKNKHIHEVVSDSEEEPTMLNESIIDSKSHEQDLSNRLDFLKGAAKSNEPNRSQSPSVEPPANRLIDALFNETALFDDPLVGHQLNPYYNNNYNIWSLLKWAYYCADISSNHTQGQDIDQYHDLYQTHKFFIDVIYEFIVINYKKFILTHINPLLEHTDSEDSFWISFFNLKEAEKEKIRNLFKTSPPLLLKLLEQVSSKKAYIFDRLVECILFDLHSPPDNKELSRNVRPHACFDKELQITVKLTAYPIDSILPYNDNMDSMKQRFKIIFQVYYMCLFFSGKSSIYEQPTTDKNIVAYIEQDELPLSSFNLSINVASRLYELDFTLFKHFFDVGFQTAAESEFNLIYIQFFFEITKNIFKKVYGNNTIVYQIQDILSIFGKSNTLDGALGFKALVRIFKNSSVYIDFTPDDPISYEKWQKIHHLIIFLFECCIARVEIKLETNKVPEDFKEQMKNHLVGYESVDTELSQVMEAYGEETNMTLDELIKNMSF